MKPAFSIYLDLVRFCAAVIVVLAHLSETFPTGLPLPFPAKDAVIVFFVLSGFVIAYVADSKEKDWFDFGVSRFTRLASVFYPALLLGLALTPAEGHFGWQGWEAMKHALAASGVNLLFLGQIWNWDITPPNNNPSWSLNYEACYYALFGIALFGRGKWKWLGLLAAIAVIGPKILILMPPWIAGCVLYYGRDRLKLTPRQANLLFLAGGALYLLYFAGNLNVHIRTALEHAVPGLMGQLQWSNRFAGDYLLTLIVAANFIAVREMDNFFTRLLLRHKGVIRAAAGHTLSIYLYHMPLMFVFGALVGSAHGVRVQAVLVALCLIPAIALLGLVTELQRGKFKAWLMGLRRPARR